MEISLLLGQSTRVSEADATSKSEEGAPKVLLQAGNSCKLSNWGSQECADEPGNAPCQSPNVSETNTPKDCRKYFGSNECDFLQGLFGFSEKKILKPKGSKRLGAGRPSTYRTSGGRGIWKILIELLGNTMHSSYRSLTLPIYRKDTKASYARERER